ncbi:uncharacterized protein V3H86_009463 [Mergus octosetaceus]
MSPPALRGSEQPDPGPLGATIGVRPEPPAQGHPDRRAVTSRPLTHGADDATRGSPAAGTSPPPHPPALPPRPAVPGRDGAALPHPAAAASAPLSEPGARRGVSLAADASVPRGGGGVGSASICPSVCLSIRPSLRGRRLVGVCVTDTAAGQSPSREQPGGWEGGRRQRRRPPAAAAPSPSPAALPGGGDLSGLAAPPPSWRASSAAQPRGGRPGCCCCCGADGVPLSRGCRGGAAEALRHRRGGAGAAEETPPGLPNPALRGRRGRGAQPGDTEPAPGPRPTASPPRHRHLPTPGRGVFPRDLAGGGGCGRVPRCAPRSWHGESGPAPPRPAPPRPPPLRGSEGRGVGVMGLFEIASCSSRRLQKETLSLYVKKK